MKMKFISVFCLLMVLLTTVSLSVGAAAFSQPSYHDEAGYLTQTEVDVISAQLDSVRNKYNVDVAIYIEEDFSSNFNAQDSADDIFDYNGYGYGDDKDGILLYICSSTREYHFTTHGEYGRKVFSNSALAFLEENVVYHLQFDDFYSAFDAYASTCEDLLSDAKNGVFYSKPKNVIVPILILIGVPVLLAFILMLSKLSKMKTVRDQKTATNYIKEGSMNLTHSRDIFMYSHTVRTAKPKDQGNHRSSSGEIHGGRGGSF